MNEKNNRSWNGNPYKVVGLIASVVAMLACIVGAVTWVAMNMAENRIAIDVLKQDQARQGKLIATNSEIIRQHRQLLSILDHHKKTLEILTDFMTQGGRFTEQDGARLQNQLQLVRDRLQHYEVLEAELRWIKKSIVDLEREMQRGFENLGEKLKVAQ